MALFDAELWKIEIVLIDTTNREERVQAKVVKRRCSSVSVRLRFNKHHTSR
jgi:hypothetical protein